MALALAAGDLLLSDIAFNAPYALDTTGQVVKMCAKTYNPS